MVERVISGGQTGAERGGLDAAIDLGLPHGGSCPEGRRAEDGVLPERYRFEEPASGDCTEQTRRNVEAADATVVFARGEPEGGSALTVSLAEGAHKPVLAIDLNAQGTFGACLVLGEFLERSKPRTLNIAGARESAAPGIAANVREIVRRVLWPVPLCEHLRPLADALAAAGIALGPIVSPYVENGSLWFMCGATFDEPALRGRLSLPEFVRYAEYDGRVAGSDSTFMCTRCDQVILGQHPQYSSPSTPRLA